MTKGLFKDFLREIKKSLNRFISILCIVAIGTAFFVGLKSSAPDMSYTMDNYYDEYNIMDLEALSTLGLTEEDLQAIRDINGVSQVQPGYFTDALAVHNGMEIVFRIHSLPRTYLDGDADSTMNKLKLTEGRLPQAPNEIVIEDSLNQDMGIEVGDVLTFRSGTKKELTDGILFEDELTVVGKAITPYYLTYDKGTSQIGGKAITLFAYIPEENFDYDGIYTEALIKVEGAEELNAFTKPYRNLVNATSVELNNIGVDRAKARGESLKEDAYKQLEEAQAELDKQLKVFSEEIEKAEVELEEARQKLVDGERELAVEREKYELEVKHAEEKIEIAEDELKEAKKALDDGWVTLNRAETEYESAKSEYEAALEQNKKYIEMLQKLEKQMAALDGHMQETKKKLEDAENNPEATEEEKETYRELLKVYQDLYETTNKNYQDIKQLNADLDKLLVGMEQTLERTEQQLKDARADLNKAQREYDDGVVKLREGKRELAEKKQEAEEKFAEAEKEIEDGWKQYNEGSKELEEKRAEGQQKLDEAELQLLDAKYQIELMENAVWYIMDRSMNYGFASYQSTVDRMEALSQVMPVFFILVAVLVCMTTMTRMVAEQRTIIGTYKALGYGNGAISSKYVLYVASASLIGAVIGAVLGSIFFPRAVYEAWAAMYSQPEFTQTTHPVIISISMAVSVLAMILTAAYTCKLELASAPAQLMRPKAPRMGKTILLERMPFIWRHMNFSQKVTARNIFRYKKRLFMTIIGIMGCTALLLAGIGLNDTISTVVSNQFEKVFQYDISVEMKEGLTEEQRNNIAIALTENGSVAEFTHSGTTSFTLSNDNHKETATAYVTEKPEEFGNYILLANRASGDKLDMTDDGIILSEKLASQLGVSVGDSVDITNFDNITKKLTVTGITENYVFHYAYMTQPCYEHYFWYSVSQNSLLIKLNDGLTGDQVNALCGELEKLEGVSSVMSFTDLAEDFEEQIVALKSIIVLIIVCAALLAFVVLYNLTNVNISERIKEIATIKVLGFKSGEVAMYVYRENFLLTLMGGVLGLVLGVGLHRIIMKSIEQSNVMFGYHIEPVSFLIALVMTCIFSILVMLYMYRKLSNIPMVESLKAIE